MMYKLGFSNKMFDMLDMFNNTIMHIINQLQLIH